MGTKIIPMLQVGKTEAWRGKVTFPRSHSKQVGELGLKTNSGQFQSLCSSAPKLCDLLMNSKVSAPCLVPSKHPVSVGCSDHDNSEDTWAAFAWGSGGGMWDGSPGEFYHGFTHFHQISMGRLMLRLATCKVQPSHPK